MSADDPTDDDWTALDDAFDAFFLVAENSGTPELRWLAERSSEFRSLVDRAKEGSLTDDERRAVARFRLQEIGSALVGLDTERRRLDAEARSIRRALNSDPTREALARFDAAVDATVPLVGEPAAIENDVPF